jgi:hypothetical protein
MTVALQFLNQEHLLSKMLLAFRYVPFGLGEVLQKDVLVHEPSIAHKFGQPVPLIHVNIHMADRRTL